jgi:hypothetical protein
LNRNRPSPVRPTGKLSVTVTSTAAANPSRTTVGHASARALAISTAILCHWQLLLNLVLVSLEAAAAEARWSRWPRDTVTVTRLKISES